MATKRLKSKIANLDGLPEALRDSYEPGSGPHEGAYVLALEEVDGLGLADVPALSGSRDHEKEEARKARAERDAAAKTLQKLQTELDAAKKALEDKAGNAKEIKAAIEAQFKAEMQEQLEQARAQIAEELTSTQQDRDGLLRQLLDGETDRFIQEGVTSGTLTMNPRVARALLRDHVKAGRGEDGRIQVGIVDPKTGKPRVHYRGGAEAPYGLQDLLADLAKTPDYAELIKTKVASGGPRPGGDREPTRTVEGALHVTAAEMRHADFYEKTVKPAIEAGRQVVQIDGDSGA